MKLLYITNGINGAGGLERVLSIKASYLADHFGYEVTILVLNDQDKDCFYKFSDKINGINPSRRKSHPVYAILQKWNTKACQNGRS